MTQTPADARGFWYYTGIIFGTCFTIIGALACVAILGLLARVVATIFLFGWRTL